MVPALSAAPAPFDDLVSVHGTSLIVAPEEAIAVLGEPCDQTRGHLTGIAGGLARNEGQRPEAALTREEFWEMVRPGNRFGIKGDGKGKWVYPLQLQAMVAQGVGLGKASFHIGSVLEVKVEGISDRIFLHPGSEVEAKAPYRLDYKGLAPKEIPNTPIVFYHERGKRPEDNSHITSAVEMWMKAVRELGYNIIYVDSIDALESEIRRFKPPILLVSAVQDQTPFVQRAYFLAKGIEPSIVTVLGGHAAIPEFARFYDMVVQGEGEIILPLILRNILGHLSRGEIEQDIRPVAWENMVRGLKGILDLPEWLRDLVQNTRYYPPVLTTRVGRMLAGIKARRYVDTDRGPFAIDVPIGRDSKGAPTIFVRSDQGIVTADVAPVNERYRIAGRLWQMKMGTQFPLSLVRFARAAEPYPVTSSEIDALFSRNLTRDYSGLEMRMREAQIQAQRGCRGDKRCAYCSIQQSADGRRASVGHIIAIMKEAAIQGARRFLFSDDLFIQDKRWLAELARRIKSEGLSEMMAIVVQTRVDTITAGVIDLFSGIDLIVCMGVETLSAKRAERMGKVRKGRGEAYVARAKEAMWCLAAAGVKYVAFMISVSPGDTIADVAEDILEQAKFGEEMYKIYGLYPFVSYNVSTSPSYGDEFTARESGLKFAQPGRILAGTESFPHFSVGRVYGDFYPFGLEFENGRLYAPGIFLPQGFEWPRTILIFQRLLAAHDGNVNLGHIFTALVDILECDIPMKRAERKGLSRAVDQIQVIASRQIFQEQKDEA